MVYSITHVNKAMNDAVLDVGYDSPSDEQREAVVKFVSGNDVFVSMRWKVTVLSCHRGSFEV